MSFPNLNKIIVIIAFLCFSLCNADDDELSVKDDKLILSPVQLVDLVQEEISQRKDSLENNHVPETTPEKTKLNDNEEDRRPKTMKDEERLKARKVWSRWSKWSKCSVTCGAGTFTRRRLCVAGRCAPGEREEQRRACALAPCSLLPDTASDGFDPADQLHDDAE